MGLLEGHKGYNGGNVEEWAKGELFFTYFWEWIKEFSLSMWVLLL
jgi:hypothetical protein